MQKALCDATFKRSPEVHKYQQPASRSGRTLTAKERYIPPARVPYVAESHIGTYPLIGRPWGGSCRTMRRPRLPRFVVVSGRLVPR